MTLARPILAAALAAVLAAGGLGLSGCAKKAADPASLAQPGDMPLKR